MTTSVPRSATGSALSSPTGLGGRLAPRTLGTIGMAASPLLLLQGSGAVGGDAAGALGSLHGAMGALYLAGWACTLVGMRRLGALGDTAGSAGVYAVQLALIGAAMLSTIQGTAAGTPGRAPFYILDLAWASAHAFMLVTGAFVLRAEVWRGWRRYLPLLVGCTLPLLVLLVALGLPAPVGAGGRGAAGLVQVVCAAAVFLLLGRAVRTAPPPRAR